MPGKSAVTPRTSRRPKTELPELSREMLERAVLKHGGRPVGRPRSSHPREAVSLRLPAEIVARWRASGAGWQTRMVELLSKSAP